MGGEVSNLFVIAMGLFIVFVGLIAIIILCKIMGYLCMKFVHEDEQPAAQVVSGDTSGDTIPNRQELIAAISAAIAEDTKADISRIRIHSIKKL